LSVDDLPFRLSRRRGRQAGAGKWGAAPPFYAGVHGGREAPLADEQVKDARRGVFHLFSRSLNK